MMNVNKRIIQNYIARMPSLSTTVTKVLEICNQPTTSPNDLNRVISLDPVLTGRVLKVVNSAYYSMDSEVTSLTRAIILLGLNTVKNLALSTAILDSMGGKSTGQGLNMDDFWLHSLGVGVIARGLAVRKNVPVMDREEYFVAGLLHDLGKIPLNQCYPDDYIQVMQSAADLGSSIYEVESQLMGMNHCIVGAMIAEKWRLHQNLSNVLNYHHCPENLNGQANGLAMMVTLANLCANDWGIGSADQGAAQDSTIDHYLVEIQMSRDELSEIHDSMFDEIEKAKVFLQLSQKG
ncbi:MAG: HDOD domain-containing protein [Deltaproteobacteria bacterium]|nr:HDOD domain-containing protein [Deltaproteobacteria bacterium]